MTTTPTASPTGDPSPPPDPSGDGRLRGEEELPQSTSPTPPADAEEDDSDTPAPLPQHPLLIAAHQLFEHGDNRAARETLSRIGDDAPQDVRAVRDALLARIKPDRFTLYAAAACAVLGLIIAYLALSA